MAALRRDVAAGLRRASSDELGVLSRLEGRLAALEDSLAATQSSQSEALRYVASEAAAAAAASGGVGSSAAAFLEAAVREEVAGALAPLAALPDAVAQAAAAAAAAGAAGGAAGDERLRAALAGVLAPLALRLEAQQAELVEDVVAELRAAPATVAPEQWNQLGGRLTELDRQLRQVREAQAQALALAVPGGGGEDPGSLASLAAELVALREELAPVAAAVKQLGAAQQAPHGAPGGGGAAVAAAIAAALQPFEDALGALRSEVSGLVALAATANGSSLGVDEGGDGDPGAASATAALLRELEDRLEAALAPATSVLSELQAQAGAALEAESLAGEGGSWRAATEAEAAVAGVLSALGGLSQRLEVVAGQVALLQAAMPAVAAAGVDGGEAEAAAAAASDAPAADQPCAQPAGQPPQSKGEAYQRMQALLRSHAEPAAGDAGSSSGGNGSGGSGGTAAGVVPIASWLGGGNEPGRTGRASPTLTTALAATGGLSASAAAASNGNGSGGNDNAGRYPQEQIQFAASLGFGPEEGNPELGWEGGARAQQQGQGEEGQQDWHQQQQAKAQQQQQPEQLAAAPELYQQQLAEYEQQAQLAQQAAQQGPQQGVQQAALAQEQRAQEGQGRQRGPAQQQTQEQPLALPEGVRQLPPGALYDRGLQLLRRGRQLAEGLAGAAQAEAAQAGQCAAASVAVGGREASEADGCLLEAAACFEAALQREPLDTRALGNCGELFIGVGWALRCPPHALRVASSRGRAPAIAIAARSSGCRPVRQPSRLVILPSSPSLTPKTICQATRCWSMAG